MWSSPLRCGGSRRERATLAILAVDDEPRALADIQRLLENSPRVARVATATSAKEALLHLGGGKYDALLLDVRMPEIEGMALARLLRRFADPPGVVFLTGHPDAAVEAFEVQALDFLVKPVTRDRLEAALDRVERTRAARSAARRRGRRRTGVVLGPRRRRGRQPQGRRQAARAARDDI